ncbi:hypothetical protein Fot_22058 [Forsythia ovata]|uniref:Uncharacterized protein n=1 Tax=Forsythia ovata TaxID=205694 RepID=A0ABD1UWM9_9LAMI
MAKLIEEEAGDLQRQIEESARQRKGKGIACSSGVIDYGDDGESISPRNHTVILGLDPNEMDLVEGWIEHVREFSGGHEDPKSDFGSWACNQYHSHLSPTDFTKLRDLYKVLYGVRLIIPSKNR